MNKENRLPEENYQGWHPREASERSQVKDIDEARAGAEAERPFRDAFPQAARLVEIYQGLTEKERKALSKAGFKVEIDLEEIKKQGVLAAEEAMKGYRTEKELAEKMRIQKTLAGKEGLLEFARNLGDLEAPEEDRPRLQALAAEIPAKIEQWERKVRDLYSRSVSMTAEKVASELGPQFLSLHYGETGGAVPFMPLNENALSRPTLTAILRGLGIIGIEEDFEKFSSEGLVYNEGILHYEKLVPIPDAPGVELLYLKFQQSGSEYQSENLILRYSPETVVDNFRG